MWFYYVLRVGRLTSPMDELLHYPVPRDGVTGFAGLVSLRDDELLRRRD